MVHRLSIKSLTTLSVILASFIFRLSASVPRPDHVVICILENHGYNQIVGSPSAPYINSLIPQSAHLMEYYALTHPSQPNYIMLFSGSNQGETSDNLPVGTPWTTLNLGASLLNTGYTFAGYSEDLPTPGSTVASSGAYARKHSPWVNWQGSGVNQIPAMCNLSMTHFPTDYTHLPDLSFVIPNQNNDMHNGSDPTRIEVGDAWVEHNLKPYIEWAKTHNSLFILTFDEDDFSPVNHIACLFVGEMVQPGSYYLNGYNHYNLLRTLEDMFALPHAGNAATSLPIEEIWRQTTSVTNTNYVVNPSYVFPNPVTDNSILTVQVAEESASQEAAFVLFDMTGRKMTHMPVMLFPGTNSMPFKKENLPSGVYLYQVVSEGRIFGSGKVIIE